MAISGDAVSAVEAAVLAALAGHAPLSGAVTGVFAAAPVRAALPYVALGETLAADWSVKDLPGRECRVLVLVQDAGELPARARRLAGAAEAALAALPGSFDGWAVASSGPVRSRVAVAGPQRWRAEVEWRVRVLAAG